MTDVLDQPTLDTGDTTGAIEIPLDQLTLPAENIGSIDPDAIEQLTASIKELGVLQPIIVVEITDSVYEVAFGRHRYVAAQEAGLESIPSVVRTFADENERWLGMLVENLHRRTIDPVSEGLAYQRLTTGGLKQRDLAEKVGRSQSHVSKRLALAELPDAAHTALAEGRLSIVGAETLSQIKDPKTVEKLAATKGKIEDWKVNEAFNEAKREATKAKLRDEQGAKGRTEVKSDRDLWSKYASATEDTATHFFLSNYGGVQLLTPKTDAGDDTKAPAKAKETAAQKRERLAREAESERWKQITAAHDDFIKAHLAGKIDAKAAQTLVNGWLFDLVVQEIYIETANDRVAELLALPLDEDADQWEEATRVLRTYGAGAAGRLKVLVATVLADFRLSAYRYRGDGSGIEPADQQVIDYLKAAGYEPSADEQAEYDRLAKPAAATDDEAAES